MQLNCFISLSVNSLSSFLTWYGLIKNGDLSVTSISTFILGHVPIASLKLNASLYLYNRPTTSPFSSLLKHELSKFMYVTHMEIQEFQVNSGDFGVL